MFLCRAIGCNNPVTDPTQDFCPDCRHVHCSESEDREDLPLTSPAVATSSMADKYPQYYKSVKHLDEVDVYAVHHLFAVNDPSGALQHASKKLLLSGVRTGEKSAYDDIREARDILTRWLELNTPTP